MKRLGGDDNLDAAIFYVTDDGSKEIGINIVRDALCRIYGLPDFVEDEYQPGVPVYGLVYPCFDEYDDVYYNIMSRFRQMRGFLICAVVLGVAGAAFVCSHDASAPGAERGFERVVEGKNVSTEEKSAVLVFAGDVMLDRYIRTVGERRGYGFIVEDLKKNFASSTAIVFNLEGSVTDNASVSIDTNASMPGHFTFTFDPNAMSSLKDANFAIAHIGNNHILNFGREGLAQTKAHLSASGIRYFGVPDDDAAQTLVVSSDGVKIGLVSYNQFVRPDPDRTIAQIKKMKQESDFVVVYAHWGNEYQKYAGANQKSLAHAFVDSGADMVIGSHPHVIQNNEIYNNAPIYYSLGNLIFDQYFTPNVQCGLVIRTLFTKGKPIKTEESTVFLVSNGKTIIKNCGS